MLEVHLHLFALKILMILPVDQRVQWRLSKNLTENRLMISILYMWEKLWRNQRENRRRREKWSDTRTPRKDVIYMSKISAQKLRKKILKNFSENMAQLKMWEFSMTKKITHSMPLFAMKSQRMLTKQRHSSMDNQSMAKDSMWITMKSRSWDNSRMKTLEIRPISKTTRSNLKGFQ